MIRKNLDYSSILQKYIFIYHTEIIWKILAVLKVLKKTMINKINIINSATPIQPLKKNNQLYGFQKVIHDGGNSKVANPNLL